MLIESAFLKLPELLLSSFTYKGNVEATVVNCLVTGLYMELIARSVPFPYSHITVEIPYPEQSRVGTVFRADLLFEAGGSIPLSSIPLLERYGFKKKQWLEAKSFFSKGNSSPSKTQNIGRVVKDVIRLCLFPEEGTGEHRDNGRYMLLVFDKHPSQYLAYSDRNWLKQIFEKRTPSVSIDLGSEKSSLVNAIVAQNSINARVDLSLSVLHFEPSTKTSSSVYWGYLFRIDKFSISINGKSIQSNGETNEYWGRDKVSALEAVRNEFSTLKSDEGDITSPSSQC